MKCICVRLYLDKSTLFLGIFAEIKLPKILNTQSQRQNGMNIISGAIIGNCKILETT